MKFPILLFFYLICSSLCAQSYVYCFGNLHAHTGFSDGNKDSVNSGMANPSGAYAYAKQSLQFNFLGISEHNHFTTKSNPGFLRPLYQQGLKMADSANQDGSFVALFGMEYGVSSSNNGHVLIYGYPKLLGWEGSVPGVNGVNYEEFNARSDYDALFTKIARRPGAFAYLAHPGFSDYSTNGTSESALAFGAYNATYDSAIIGMPLRSGLAFSTADNYSDYAQGHYFNYYKRLLYQGYHLGIGYDHDNHYTNFGRSNGGRTVVLCKDLSRASLLEGLLAMRFYGSDDSNAKLSFACGGAEMGSTVTGSVFPTFVVKHTDPDGEAADSIKIWKGFANSGGLWAEIIYSSLHSDQASFTDSQVEAGKEYYYFTEVRQADGQWMVSSPIWFRGLAPLVLSEEQGVDGFLVVPDPETKHLRLKGVNREEVQISMADLSGKVCLNKRLRFPNLDVDVSGLKPGWYVLKLESASTQQSMKLLIE